jgi:hypothetical protein
MFLFWIEMDLLAFHHPLLRYNAFTSRVIFFFLFVVGEAIHMCGMTAMLHVGCGWLFSGVNLMFWSCVVWMKEDCSVV